MIAADLWKMGMQLAILKEPTVRIEISVKDSKRCRTAANCETLKTDKEGELVRRTVHDSSLFKNVVWMDAGTTSGRRTRTVYEVVSGRVRRTKRDYTT